MKSAVALLALASLSMGSMIQVSQAYDWTSCINDNQCASTECCAMAHAYHNTANYYVRVCYDYTYMPTSSSYLMSEVCALINAGTITGVGASTDWAATSSTACDTPATPTMYLCDGATTLTTYTTFTAAVLGGAIMSM